MSLGVTVEEQIHGSVMKLVSCHMFLGAEGSKLAGMVPIGVQVIQVIIIFHSHHKILHGCTHSTAETITTILIAAIAPPCFTPERPYSHHQS
jgi:hypothetical protein